MSFTLLESQTLSSETALVTFTSIDSSYQTLRVEYSYAFTADDTGTVEINSSSGSIHQYIWARHQTGSWTHEHQTGADKIKMMYSDGTTNNPQAGWMNLYDYADTGEWTTIAAEQCSAKRYSKTSGIWRSTSAVNRLDFRPVGFSNFRVGTTFTLYGLGNS